MTCHSRCKVLLWLLSTPVWAMAQTPAPLIVVEDHGGASALPYYRALNLQPRTPASPRLADPPQPPRQRFGEADMLPVRSTRLTPGQVVRRVIEAPGLPPMFLIGDDATSRRWLKQHLDTLRALKAWGLVVNVDSDQALAELRQLAPGLTLTPAPADQLAEQLDLRHYPVLLTATGIEQ